MKSDNIIGQKFGRLTVLDMVKITTPCGRKRPYAVCNCECGTQGKPVDVYGLFKGSVVSCGCHNAEQHQKQHNGRGTKEWHTWKEMIKRCYNVNMPYYKDYGGRGIRVCDRWRHSFPNFLADMGYAPSAKHSLDRKEVDGNYEPDNCRWATELEQQNNRRNNRRVEHEGKTLTVAQWARELGLTRHQVSYGLKKKLGMNEIIKRYQTI